MRWIYFSILFLMTSLAMAVEVFEKSFEFYSLEKSMPAYNYRISVFSSFFGDSLFAEDKDATFIFYERNGIQRLFVFNSGKTDKIATFQIPETKILPSLHPEQYMDERKRLQQSQISREKCENLAVDGRLVLPQLDSLQLDSHLYVRPYFQNEDFSEYKINVDENHLIMGFSQRGGKRQYFYYVKYVDFWEQQPEYFSIYAKVFEVVEKFNRTIFFPECR